MADLRNRWVTAAIRLIIGVGLMLGFGYVRAQNDVQPIHVGENLTGEIGGAYSQYALSVETPMNSLIVQVLALNDGVTGFQVIDETGEPILSAPLEDGETVVTATAALPTAGLYLIQIEGAPGGQYVVSVQMGNVLPPPIALVLGERISGVVDSSAPAKVYALHAAPERLLSLSVLADFPETSPTIWLRDGSGTLIALINGALQGVALRIPRGDAGYTLTVTHSGSAAPNRYSLCLETEDETTRCDPYIAPPMPEITVEDTPTAAPTPFPDGACLVTPSVGVYVNIRETPNLSAGIVGELAAEGRALVIGRSADGIWWQIRMEPQTGWVSSAVTGTEGLCESIPTVEP
ncbi:MAG: SH3 domain-containing protein [Anaerolineae bacterium]